VSVSLWVQYPLRARYQWNGQQTSSSRCFEVQCELFFSLTIWNSRDFPHRQNQTRSQRTQCAENKHTHTNELLFILPPVKARPDSPLGVAGKQMYYTRLGRIFQYPIDSHANGRQTLVGWKFTTTERTQCCGESRHHIL
jgi:hypothetical protein